MNDLSDNLLNLIEQHIYHRLSTEYLRIAPADLMRMLKKEIPCADRKIIRQGIEKLVMEGKLAYSHHFSSSQLELSSSGIQKITDRLFLNSSPSPAKSIAGCVEILIQNGSAFGMGDHPTTLLALKAVDHVSAGLHLEKSGVETKMLDIGTGTGVLAIAAVALGIGRAVGLDIDHMACYEARNNVRCNHLDQKIGIVSGTLDAIKPMMFDLIAANLRPPTLLSLMPEMATRTSKGGYWILSGFRPEEALVLKNKLPYNFHSIDQWENRNWAAMTLKRI